MDDRYEKDLKEMFLAADNSMMCESHPGREWPHGDCLGPGTPWIIRGRTLIEEAIADLRASQVAGKARLQQFYDVTTTLLAACPFGLVEEGATQEYHDALLGLTNFRAELRDSGAVVHDESKWTRGLVRAAQGVLPPLARVEQETADVCGVVGEPEAGHVVCARPAGHDGYHQQGAVRWLGYHPRLPGGTPQEARLDLGPIKAMVNPLSVRQYDSGAMYQDIRALIKEVERLRSPGAGEARLRELARLEASRRHHASRQFGSTEHDTTRLDLCSHPDCMLVRAAQGVLPPLARQDGEQP